MCRKEGQAGEWVHAPTLLDRINRFKLTLFGTPARRVIEAAQLTRTRRQ